MATEQELFQQIQSYSIPSTAIDESPAIQAQLANVQAAKQATQEAQAKVNRYDQLAAALSGVSQGLSFSFADEAAAKLRSLTGGQSYEQELADEARMREQVIANAPKTALGTEVISSLAPALLGAGVTAPGLASRLLLGATGKTAPTVAQLAGIGAVQGGLVGAGKAAPEERVAGGVLGAGFGAGAGAVLGKVGQSLSEYLTQPFYTATLQGERGAIGLGGKAQYTPEEFQLAKILSQTQPGTVKDAEIALMRAGELGKPVFIPEAVQSPSLFQEAKFIANYPASVEIAKTAIEQRALEATNRITQSLDVINPQRNVTAGANKLVQGAKTLLDDLGIARKEATRGLYEAAFEKTPELVDPNSVRLIAENPRIQEAIKAVRKELPELVQLPDTSIEVLHQAQQYLSGKAQAVKNKFTAGKIKDARSELMKAIKSESSEYEQATNIFAQMSKGLTAKEQSKIGFLANVSPDKPGTIGKVFALDADTIASLRDDFSAAGKLEEWESGVRSYLQRAVEIAPDERNPINKIIGSPALKDKLKAALGDKYDAVIEPLTVEQTILKGQREYFAGSPTAPLLQREQAVAESLSAIQKAMKFAKDPINEGGKMLQKALGGGRNPEFYENYAKLLFSAPEQGLETIGRVSKLAEGLRAARATGEKAGAVIGTTAGREPATAFKAIEEAKKSNKPKLLGVTGAATAIGTTPEIDDLFNQINSYEVSSKKEVKSSGSETPTKFSKQNISALIAEQPPIIQAIIKTESSGKPKAVSSKGAQGLMQLMPATAKDLGIDPTDPVQNIEGGTRYFDQMKKQFGDIKLALAAYNWGPGNLSKAKAKVESKGQKATWENILKYTTVPQETEDYVNKVTSLV